MNDIKALPLYPEQQEIDTLAHRIRDLLPGADKFGDAVLTAFAQISLAHGLDPFIGECWIIPTKRGPRIRAGIEGHRKAAHKQSPYQICQRQMTADERDEHDLRDNQIGAVTEIYRADSVIHSQVFRPTLGYGIYNYRHGDIPAHRIPHTKSAMWVAFKRSEQDALRKAFDLPFVSEENGNGAPANENLPQVQVQALQPALPRPDAAGSAAQAAADLYGDWDGDVFAAGEDDPSAETPAEEEPIDATATVISDEPQDNGNETDKKPATRFRTPEAAVTWALRQGAFTHIDHARNAYKKLRINARPKTAPEMGKLWRADVAYRLEDISAGLDPQRLAPHAGA